VSNQLWLSFTQLNMFQECPEKWYSEYVEGIKGLSGKSAMWGTIFHALAATGELPERGEYSWSLSEQIQLEKEALEYYNKALQLPEFNEIQAGAYKEKKCSFCLDEENEIYFTTIIDNYKIVGDMAYISDWKTGKYKKSYIKPLQLDVYAWSLWKNIPEIKKAKANLLFIKKKLEEKRRGIWTYPNGKEFGGKDYEIAWKEYNEDDFIKIDDLVKETAYKMYNYKTRNGDQKLFNSSFETCNFCVNPFCKIRTGKKIDEYDILTDIEL